MTLLQTLARILEEQGAAEPLCKCTMQDDSGGLCDGISCSDCPFFHRNFHRVLEDLRNQETEGDFA